MPQRVLVIDDSSQIHRLVSAWLKSELIEVSCAPTASQGYVLALSWQPDLILLDINLPDLNGFELCRQMKSDDAVSRIPIVFLTGANSPEDRVAGLNLGAVDYIVKPFHPAEFQARVRAALRTKYLLDLLQHRAQIDGLTGLRNRAYLDEVLASEIAMVNRHPGPLACVMVDVDHFKAVNDIHGHAAGDEVLRGVAEVLQESARVEDVITRYGGEEFTIVTRGAGAVGASTFAERARAAVEKMTIRRANMNVKVTCSFGVAAYDPAAPDSLLEYADAAMYDAKQTGRNKVSVFEPAMLDRLRHRAA